MKHPTFCLSCSDCDAGQGVASWTKAIMLGWHDVYQEPSNWTPYTHIGTCHDCWLAKCRDAACKEAPLFNAK